MQGIGGERTLDVGNMGVYSSYTPRQAMEAAFESLRIIRG